MILKTFNVKFEDTIFISKIPHQHTYTAKKRKIAIEGLEEKLFPSTESYFAI